jgi:hypothetical protein
VVDEVRAREVPLPRDVFDAYLWKWAGDGDADRDYYVALMRQDAIFRAEVQRLRTVIVNAPHGPRCRSGGCNCWKVDAL